MLKNKTKIITIFAILILLFSTTFVFAENETSNNEIAPISTNTNEVGNSVENAVSNKSSENENYKKSDVYLTGDNITIDYIVDGNLFVCADTVTINSQIGGDAFILAKNLIINEKAYVFSNLFAISDSIEIKGVIYDIYALAENITVSGGYIYRDLKVSCDTLNINGIIGRNAFVSCSSINFNTDQSTNGIIYGNLDYTSNSEISIPENVVNGQVSYHKSSNSAQMPIHSIIASYILNLGTFLAFLLIIWLICSWLAPKFLNNTNTFVGKKSLSVLGYGLLTVIAIPVVCIILLLLQLTVNVSLLLLALFILALVVSKSIFTITANNYICSKFNINKNLGILGMLIVSGIIIWGLTQIPYIGWVISFISTLFGLGILVVAILPKRLKKVTDSDDKK